MKINFEQVKLPLDYDPFEEDCCGSYLGDKVTIESGALKLHVQECPSGIGPEIRISAEGPNGQKTTQNLIAYISDDDGELVFQLDPFTRTKHERTPDGN